MSCAILAGYGLSLAPKIVVTAEDPIYIGQIHLGVVTWGLPQAIVIHPPQRTLDLFQRKLPIARLGEVASQLQGAVCRGLGHRRPRRQRPAPQVLQHGRTAARLLRAGKYRQALADVVWVRVPRQVQRHFRRLTSR